MRKKGYLLIAGSLNFFIAMIHIVTIFVGAPAYYFLDAPKLAVYSELGFKYPIYLTLLVTSGFFIAGLYAFCEAGSKIKLPMQAFMIKFFAILFTFRGLAILWFISQQIRAPDGSFLKEIVFSLCALMIASLYWMGISIDQRDQSIRS